VSFRGSEKLMTRTVFRGGGVFDGTGPPRVGEVLIEDERIADVGAGSFDADDEVDCQGLVVLPGLFDCHTHVTFSGELGLQSIVSRPWSIRYFEAVRNLERTLEVGITTIRDAMGADLGVKRAVERGLVRGPRLQISIAMLSQTGGMATIICRTVGVSSRSIRTRGTRVVWLMVPMRCGNACVS
jgi:imidazolonepropionase-like amidohydrolase